MNTLLLTSVLTAGVLCSCTTPAAHHGIALDKYLDLRSGEPITATHYKLSCRLIDTNGKEQIFALLIAKVGRAVTAEIAEEVPVPVAFALAEVSDSSALPSYAITPTTPTKFASRLTGDFLTLTVTNRDTLIEVVGTLNTKSLNVQDYTAAGEGHSPILTQDRKVVLTENKCPLPEFVQTENMVRICGRPGTPHRIKVNGHRQLEIICQPLK